jgi:hypothetical protein
MADGVYLPAQATWTALQSCYLVGARVGRFTLAGYADIDAK